MASKPTSAILFYMTLLFAAPHSTFAVDGSLNTAVIAQQAQHLIDAGCHGAFVGGSTGEWPSLNIAEREAILCAWSDAVRDTDLLVIGHVGHHCLSDAQQLAKLCESLDGVSGIASLVPSFFKPQGLGGIIKWCQAIAQCAPETPFYYYHIPPLTQVGEEMSAFLQQSKTAIPTLAGIKFTDGDLDAFARCTLVQDVELFYGMDEQLLGGIRAGAHGAVGSSYNFAAPLYRELIAAEKTGQPQRAETLQALAVSMIETIAKAGYLPMAKALVVRLGIEVGSVRLPLEGVQPQQVDAVVEQLKALGLQETTLGWSAIS
jgi:N-acetylneuraminate lyase